MKKVLNKVQMLACDKATLTNIKEYDLILKVGENLAKVINYPNNILIVVGNGNNGADGFALAYYLAKEKKNVSIFETTSITNINSLKIKEILNVKYVNNLKNEYECIIDAIFGVSFHGELKDSYKDIVTKLNEMSGLKVAIDINSGLLADSGKTSYAFKSDITLAINNFKPGHFLNDAKDYIKSLLDIDVGIETITPYSIYLENEDYKNLFIKRKENSHKGSYGTIGLMGGSIYYSGAIKLANLALCSLVSGAGIAKIIAPNTLKKAILPYLLEQTFYPLPASNNGFKFNETKLKEASLKLNSLAFGMGVGRNKEIIKILNYLLLNYQGKLLIDADGLYALSKLDLNLLNNSKANIILTPHIKEFSRLINIDINTILDNPIYYANEFSKKYHVILLLKHTSSIVSYQGVSYILNQGSVALSKGGSGDLLTGVISGMLGYLGPLEATLAGTYLFLKAGELANKRFGSYATLGRNIIPLLQEILKNIEK